MLDPIPFLILRCLTVKPIFFLNAPLMRPRTLWACHSVAATGPLEQLNNLSRFAAPIFP
jgi:hypothetical protein